MSRSVKAIAAGRMAREIAPIPGLQRTGPAGPIDQDEHSRNTPLEALAQLRPLFPGVHRHRRQLVGINDGAAALLIASESALENSDLTPLAGITGLSSVGVPLGSLGIGPEPATRRLLGRAGLEISDIDLFELNEAEAFFGAAQPVVLMLDAFG